ncbi:MAG: alpha-L-fucosidase [Thermomicrobiales bacterium]|nr:alpha-L-fucosidase [Thermomicrobiales bacterium]
MTERTTWFVQDRFGLFIHWGVYAVAARHEWVQSREKRSTDEYGRYMAHFDPDLYDPAAWAREAKAAGMRYAVITAKHHDGFAMWDTSTSDYKVTNTPAGCDLLREWVDAFRTEGLRIGFYYSVIDWHHPHYTMDRVHPQRDEDWDAFNDGRDMTIYREYMYAQVRELLTNYGTVDVLWFDWTPPEKSAADWDSPALTAMVRELQPHVILNDRIDYPEGADLVTPEEYQAKSWPTRNGERVLWETCQTLNGSWGYDRDNHNWKSPELLISLLIDTVSKGGNLLLNVGPTARGEFQPEARTTLETIGNWMRQHSGAIYGCTASDHTAPADCRYTQNGSKLYLHILNWPLGHIHLDGLAGQVTFARFLHDGSEVAFKDADPNLIPQNTDMPEEAGDVILTIPTIRPSVAVPVIELTLV